jgi:hypothetical protein
MSSRRAHSSRGPATSAREAGSTRSSRSNYAPSSGHPGSTSHSSPIVVEASDEWEVTDVTDEWEVTDVTDEPPEPPRSEPRRSRTRTDYAPPSASSTGCRHGSSCQSASCYERFRPAAARDYDTRASAGRPSRPSISRSYRISRPRQPSASYSPRAYHVAEPRASSYTEGRYENSYRYVVSPTYGSRSTYDTYVTSRSGYGTPSGYGSTSASPSSRSGYARSGYAPSASYSSGRYAGDGIQYDVRYASPTASRNAPPYPSSRRRSSRYQNDDYADVVYVSPSSSPRFY